MYTSTQAHSSIAKDARVAGILDRNTRLVPTLADFSMDPDALRRMMREDEERGLIPCFVCATVGTTSSGAIDPVRAIGELCREKGAWLHVRAAYAGAASVCEEFRPALNDGLDLADSYVFNPHKWLLTTFDCSTLWVEDREALIDALSITPEYLRNAASDAGTVIDYRDWQIPLGRRSARSNSGSCCAHYGVEGLRAHPRVRLGEPSRGTRGLRRTASSAPRSCLSLVTFRLKGPDAHPRLRRERDARAFLSHTRAAGPGDGRAGTRSAWPSAPWACAGRHPAAPGPCCSARAQSV